MRPSPTRDEKDRSAIDSAAPNTAEASSSTMKRLSRPRSRWGMATSMTRSVSSGVTRPLRAEMTMTTTKAPIISR